MADCLTPSRATLLATASSVVAGYNAWSLPAILAPRSPTCTQLILPKSLRILPMNNEQYAAYFAPNLSLFRDFKVTVHETIADVEARKVVMQATSTADTDIGLYGNEYVLVIEMGQDGTQAEKVVEWVDSGYALKFMVQLTQHAEAKAKGDEISGGEQKL